MARTERNFVKGVMNKSVDERLLPNGEYTDGMNIRLGSTEETEIGSVENSKGNLILTNLDYDGAALSSSARTIGALDDGSKETLYWFVHDPANVASPSGKVDLVVSFNVLTSTLTYHLISTTTLNFNPDYLITGVNKIDNLLFWTDDYNAPRKINVTTVYPPPIAGVDQFADKDINVIVQPPHGSPTIVLYNQPGQENFIETRFISFATRYKYQDGEYSALSQFSRLAFDPERFGVDTTNYLNSGMLNQYNAVQVSFNSGDDDVVAVDLCFKYGDENIVRVIEKFDRDTYGWPPNTLQSITFSNSKIYTVLPESEILRLFDNVPRYAKAQTLMGNRLMYGNYVDGYDLIDSSGQKCDIDFQVERVSEALGLLVIEGGTSSASWGLPTVTTTVTAGQADYDLTPIMNTYGLKKGSSINFDFQCSHDDFIGTDILAGTPPQAAFGVEVTLTLSQDYNTVFDFANSSEFRDVIGTIANIQPMATCQDGITATDAMNCVLVAPATPPPGYIKLASGINVQNQPIQIWATAGSNVISLQPVCIQYEQIGFPLLNDAYEVFRVTSSEVTFSALGDKSSLHSNRDYEAALIYMDDYNRATTALVSQFNTIFVPCANSVTKNRIRTIIPPNQKPPAWATRYKWALKPSETTYETIYSSVFYPQPLDGSVWFKLDGENQLKIEVGDHLRVKRDTNGALQSCVETVVLDKESQPEGFITGGDTEIEGVYMRLKPNNFAAAPQPDAIVGGTTVFVSTKQKDDRKFNYYPYLQYPLFQGADNINWDIPQGATVEIRVEFFREDRGACAGKCGAAKCLLDISLVASNDYDTFYDFWVGEAINVATDFGSDCFVECQDDGGEAANVFCANLYDLTTLNPQPWCTDTKSQGTNQYQIVQDSGLGGAWTTAPQYLTLLGGIPFCTGVKRAHSTISCYVRIIRSDNTVIFETIPFEAAPDIFYIGSETFDITGGFHMGNEQDQTALLSAESLLDSFNCYTFGNGVESYKIEDSLTGHSFGLGEQATAVAAQDYKEADRYADITYSGVYNNESNVNKLNEFNLGLANFKSCEESFGSIEVLSGRETDVLTLQEDKISYVLAGKNLLSDAAAGGAITSIPEVLGTQIARIEEYGISHNPESYIEFGLDKFFTDAKRGAVIQLKGAPRAEQLNLISEMGLRSWFRDLFLESFNTQKLGAFDPYMNEYVLSTNDIEIPTPSECLECGFTTTFTVPTGAPLTLCVELGDAVGDVTIAYSGLVDSTSESIEVSILYNAITTVGPILNAPWPLSSFFSIDKNLVTETTAYVTITSNGGTQGVVQLTVGCPEAQQLTIIPVCITSDSESGLLIHNQFNFTQGAFNSPTNTRPVIFGAGAGDVVSDYAQILVPQGTSFGPPDGSTVTMYCNKIGADNFVFDVAIDKFRWLRSPTEYLNNPADITSLLAASTQALPLIVAAAPTVYSAEFVMPISNDEYLYLIYDYRNVVGIELCYSNIGAIDACCDCEVCETCQEFDATLPEPALLDTCPLVRGVTLWFDGEGAEPNIGDPIYTDSACTLPYVDTPVWLGINAINTEAIYIVGGIVTNKSGCV